MDLDLKGPDPYFFLQQGGIRDLAHATDILHVVSACNRTFTGGFTK